MKMKLKILLGAFFLMMMVHCGGGGSDSAPAANPVKPLPGSNELLSFLTSEVDVEKTLNLTGRLEVLKSSDLNGAPVKTADLPVSFVPKDPNRVNSPKVIRVIPEGGVHFEDLGVGEYLFRIRLFHRSPNQGDIQIASIEQNILIESGKDSAVNFSGSVWHYDFDDDSDGYSNVTELMNGHFEKKQDNVGGSTTVWIAEPTNVKDGQSHPEDVRIIDPKRIGSTSPDSGGHSKIVGDPLSVQSGVLVTVVHKGPDGVEKERVTVYSRLDGSFEANLTNSVQGDLVQVYTTSSPTLANDPAYSSLSQSDPSLASVSLEVHYVPVKVLNCFSTNLNNRIPGSGFIAIQGEGFGGSESENEIIFPTADGLGVKATEFFISSLAAKSTELTVKIPDRAVSGFPIVHNSLPVNNSYGRCDKNSPIVIDQGSGSNTGSRPDLINILLEAPLVALVGDTVSFDLMIANQGNSDVNRSFVFRNYISLNDSDSLSGGDIKEIFTNTSDFALVPPDMNAQEISLLKTGEVAKVNLRFRLSKLTSIYGGGNIQFTGPGIRFKTGVDRVNAIRGDIDELIETNNVIVSPSTVSMPNFIQGSYLHYIDLGLKDNANTGLLNDGSTNNQISFDGNINIQNLSPSSPIELQLIKGSSKAIQLGTLSNSGTYPLKKVPSQAGGFDYVNNNPADSSDPLDTTKTVYREVKRLASQINQVNGEEDLLEPLMVSFLDEIERMNLVEVPVRVHVVYSKDDQLYNINESTGVTDDQDVVCDGCEFCVDRLEKGGFVGNDKNVSYYKGNNATLGANNINLQMALDSGNIGVGNGYLFIVAEPIRLKDLREEGVPNNFSWCGLPEDHPTNASRKSYNFSDPVEGNGTKPMSNFEPKH
ncbi:MAG: hypothetical protein JNK65_04880, partial [Deltaproteobacteria bacterium]|nr:hypothetical protein [Deltaproteobacteria bacterium]